MPEKQITDTTPASEANRVALYALIRFSLSIGALVVLAITDLNNDRDSIPTLVYLIIGALNGVDVYNLITKVKIK